MSLVSIQEIARVLRRTEEQIMDLMKEKKIGYNTTPGGMYLFSPEQVLSKISPLEVEAPLTFAVNQEVPVEVSRIPADKPSETKPVPTVMEKIVHNFFNPVGVSDYEATKKKPVTSTKKGRKRG